VKICSLYGAGFYYMPGTDTCLKVGGFVRAEMNFNANGSFAQYSSINFDDRRSDREVTRARGVVTLDARTQTEFGTLRSYMALGEQIDNATGTTGGGGGGSDVRTWSNAFFIQLAGFTAGATTSFFDFDTFAYSNQTNVMGSSWAGAGILLFAYTAQFGNGFSASISAEDTEARRVSSAAGILGATAGNDQGYAGRRWPDVVGNLRIDQAWGSAQVMGAIHNVNAGYYAPTVSDAHASDEVGWAVGAGIKLNLPMIGAKDYVIAQVTWAKGAMNYVAQGIAANYNIREGFPTATGTSRAFGGIYDATFETGTDLDLTEGWSVTGGFEHWWVPNWRTSLYGGYAAFNYSDVSSARVATVAATTTGVVPTAGSADWSLWQIGSRTVWTVVPNLDLSVDVMYNHVNTAFDGTPGYEDKGWVAGMFRVQRNFYP
jgi:hypothetical protein